MARDEWEEWEQWWSEDRDESLPLGLSSPVSLRSSSHPNGQLPPQISRLQWCTVTRDQSLLAQSVNSQFGRIDSKRYEVCI